ncbi:glycoside hydrolase family 38 N-terminal domain-containing protein [Halobacillus mangrovi]|uniref:Alpha-mannosidase n=1 Tax=Halobacillus mangrovi TaxID=402384 RepID=A0A1W5ZS97_9BACI|nr:glycoside hydrolase family 38 C-terminal domain-containing protein [Halobacillus mangrovi]ARI76159.1 alpha-mannosidase [Halobacillus mangrovi]
MSKKRVYVVPHSHWDREWYFTIEDSNLLLAENMDHLIELLEENSDYHGYVFDAQISVVDEYLKVRPHNSDRLRSLVEAKRIFVGPWYTQADSLLVHKESLVRNLLYGVKGAEKMGHSMNIGYLPDIFGQNHYLPSLFKGFGIDHVILQRGVYSDQLDENLNFRWQSPDGEQVQANLMKIGYGPGKFLSADEDFHKDRLQPMLDTLASLNRDTDRLLLPSGGDQVLVRDYFPETVEKLNANDDRYEYVLSDYETFMEDTWQETSFDHVIEGELIATEGSRIHNTIRSQRYDIKKWNHIVEHKIINQLEPLATIAQSLGLRYPQEWLDDMWKNLFDVHAHDSIGGCNSDDTNEDIIKRLVKINRQADGLMNMIKRQITKAVSEETGSEDIFVVFNTMPKLHQKSVETVLFTKDPDFNVRYLDGEPLDYCIRKQDYLSGGKKIVVTAEGDKEVEIPGYYRTEVHITDVEVPALGYTTLQIVKAAEKADHLASSKADVIENDSYVVSFSDGEMKLTEKTSNLSVGNFIQFEDTADAGDSYDYSPLPGDQAILTGKAKLIGVRKSPFVEEMTIEHELILPVDLDSRKAGVKNASFTIRTVLELRKEEDLLRVKHEIDNNVHDHRVRVLVQTPVEQPAASIADQGYSLIERPSENPRMDIWREQGYKEAPVPIYTVEQFASVDSDQGSLAAFTKGLKEYEVLKEKGQLALTLFRSVGLLGRDDLEWRPGRASGINNKVVTTPDAQMEGELTFDYAIQLSGNCLDTTALFETADHYNERYVTYQHQSLNTFEERLDRFEIPQPVKRLPGEYSLVTLDNENLFVSAVKQAHDGKNIIMRVYNPTHHSVEMDVRGDLIGNLKRVNLAEVTIDDAPLTVPAKGFQTIQFSVEGDLSL